MQAAAEQVAGLKQEQVFEGDQTPALGGDVTRVKGRGQWLPLGLTVDDVTGLVLTVDGWSGEDAETLKQWVKPIAEAVGAEVLVTDDADAFKQVADELGLEQQVCKSHGQRNTEALIEGLKPLAAADVDGSPAALGVSPAQAVADLERRGALIRQRRPEDAEELVKLYTRYQDAAPPKKGETASVAYRMRCAF